MRKIVFVFIVSLFLLTKVFSGILDENEYYKKAVELFDNAVIEYEKGDYDRGLEYSESAKEYIIKAYQYNEAYLLRARLEAKREIADLKLNNAYEEGAENSKSVGDLFNEAVSLFDEGDKYYDIGDLTDDLSGKKEAYSIGINKFLKSAEITSRILITLAEEKENEQKNKILVKKSNKEVLALKEEAESLIGKVKNELEYAKEHTDEFAYKNKVKEADMIFDNALLLFYDEDYDLCLDALNKVLDIIGNIKYGLIFPRYYKVRPTPDDRDSLWKIAEFDFVYGDGSKWLILYEANKERLKYPKNPNIILPERIIEIPSINGEKRRGIYNPDKKYPKFDPEKNYR